MKIAIDFDGTIVDDKYPEIGREKPFAIDTLRMLLREKHQLILWSVREGKALQEAVDWCHKRGVDFWAVNRDFPEEDILHNEHFSRKIKADIFIDDRNVGGLPDWGDIYRMLSEGKTLAQVVSARLGMEEKPKTHWYDRLFK